MVLAVSGRYFAFSMLNIYSIFILRVRTLLDTCISNPLTGLPNNHGLPAASDSPSSPSLYLLQCYDAIPLNHTLAVQHLSALAAYFKEYYVFADICRNPTASPQHNSLGLTVYSGKVDLVGGLNALAHSIRATPGLASLGYVAFRANALLNRLRDALVSLPGNNGGGSYGGVLKGHTLALLSFPSDTNASGVSRTLGMVALAVTKHDGRVIVSQLNQTSDGQPVRIRSIDGMEPMDWLISVAQSSLVPLPFKVMCAVVRMPRFGN